MMWTENTAFKKAILDKTITFTSDYQKMIFFFQSLNNVESWGSLYLLKILQENNIFQRPDKVYSAEEIQKLLGVSPFYSPFIICLLELLTRRGLINLLDSGHYHCLQTTLVQPDLLNMQKSELIKNFPFLKGNICLLDQALQHYMSILRGELNFLTIMFPSGSFDIIEDIYKNNLDAAYYNKLTAEIIDIIVQHHFNSQPISILEIGAGIGSTTTYLLPLLKKNQYCSHYLYTDISRSFIQFGKKSYGDSYPFLSFSTLNIAKSPLDQGVAAKSYDIAIATNVLHATDDVSEALKNVKSFLKPNGILIINEGIVKRDYASLAYGLLPGWWAFKDNHWRISGSPFITAENWKKLLYLSGFAPVSSLSEFNKESGTYQDIFIAQSV